MDEAWAAARAKAAVSSFASTLDLDLNPALSIRLSQVLLDRNVETVRGGRWPRPC